MSSYVDHFVRDIAGQLSATICLPKEKPAFEIFFPQAEWQVLHGHRPGIAAWPTNKCFQKVCDDFQVVFPIYRAKYRNWKEYCNARWNYHRSYAYRLIDYAKAVRAAAKVSTNGDTKPKALKTEGSFRASQKAEKQAKQKQSSAVSSPGQAGFRILPSQVVEDLDVESEFTKIREQVELWAAKFTQSGLSPLGRKGSQLHEWDSVRSGVHGRPTGSRGGISMSDKWDFLNLPIQPNDNFDVYWRWIVERHRIFEHRLAGDSLIGAPPGDKFLSTLEAYSFCNPFRVLDQGSQNVIYLQQASGLSAEPVEVFFRTALYRAFNSPDPLAGLIEQIGDVPSWQNYDFPVYSDALAKVEETNGTLYRGAYMFNDSLVFGGDRNSKAYPRKYQGSLRLVQRLIEDGLVERVCDATTVEEIFNALNNRGKYIAFSDGFLAMQLAYDLANSDITRSGEDDFWSIRGGNGYGDGMKFCFGRSFSITNANDLRVMAKILWRLWEEQDRCFEILGYPPIRLFGQRKLKPIDLENSFCETNKMLKALLRSIKPKRLYKGSRGRLEKVLLPRKWAITHES